MRKFESVLDRVRARELSQLEAAEILAMSELPWPASASTTPGAGASLMSRRDLRERDLRLGLEDHLLGNAGLAA